MRLAFAACMITMMLIASCAEETSRVPRTAGYLDQITVLHAQSGSGMPDIGGFPGIEIDVIPHGASSEAWIGNFFLSLRAEGDMTTFRVKEQNGNERTVKAYNFKKLHVRIEPDKFMRVEAELGEESHTEESSEYTRARLIDVAFVRLTDKGESVMHTVYPGFDTTSGGAVSDTVDFGSSIYTPPNVRIMLKFDVGRAGTQAALDTPSMIAGLVPKTVVWVPFPEEPGGEPAVSELKAGLFGYVSDKATGTPIAGEEMTFSGGADLFATTDQTGRYEFVIHIDTQEDGTPIPVNYYLNFDGCKVQECKRASRQIDQLFLLEQGVTDYTYGTNNEHYPYPGDTPSLVEGPGGRLYYTPTWVSGQLQSSETKKHDFSLSPAPPAAYLGAGKKDAQINETITFEGHSISTYEAVDRWKMDFGDLSAQASGIGKTFEINHTYPQKGEYEAKAQFGTPSGRWSPWYKIKIAVGIIRPTAKITSITPNPLILRFNVTDSGQTLIPGSATIKAEGAHPTGNTISGWALEPGGHTGQGKSLTLTKSFGTPGSYQIKARFQDSLGTWSEYATAMLKVKNASEAGAIKAHASIEPDPYIKESNIFVKGTERTFNGWAEGGNIVRYRWDLDGDGTFETASAGPGEVTHTFENPGELTVAFQAEDEMGNTDTVRIPIRALDVSASSDMEPASHRASMNSTIKMWYTLENKDSEDVDVQSASLLWWADFGYGYRQYAYEQTPAWTGKVIPWQSKTLWIVTETADTPGDWRGDIQIATQYGLVKASLFKTIEGGAGHDDDHDGTVSFASGSQRYAVGDNMTLLVQETIPGQNLCDWMHKTGNNDWVLALERLTTDNNGKGAFYPTAGPAGTYKAFAECAGIRSNEIQFTVVPMTLTLSADKSHYHKDSSDEIVFSAQANFQDPRCYIGYKSNQHMPEFLPYDQMQFDSSGAGTYTMQVFMDEGGYKAKLSCDNGMQSNEIAFDVKPPGGTATMKVGKSTYLLTDLQSGRDKLLFIIESDMPATRCLISTKRGSEDWLGLATVTTDSSGGKQYTYSGGVGDYWTQAGSWKAKATCDDTESSHASYSIIAPAAQPTLTLRTNQRTYSQEGLSSGRERLTYLITSNIPSADCIVAVRSEQATGGSWKPHARIGTDSNGNGAYTIARADLPIGDYYAKATCGDIKSQETKFSVTGALAAAPEKIPLPRIEPRILEQAPSEASSTKILPTKTSRIPTRLR